MKITVSGTGYVGLSLAVLLGRCNDVAAVDIIPERVNAINHRISPIQDPLLSKTLAEGTLQLEATTDAVRAYSRADLIIIATPTDYDPESGSFNVSSVEDVLKTATDVNPDATVVIRSTIPVGFTEKAKREFGNGNILFSAEFLREAQPLYDNLHPSRIIVGCDGDKPDQRRRAAEFASLLTEAAEDRDIPVKIMGTMEAEAVKLFSNTYLAMRIGFFNEMDMYAESRGLNAKNIIDGVCLDPRIGGYYNNPSFGYGGYCLPKDTKQLLAEYRDLPNRLISAVVETNQIRKAYITDRIAALAEMHAGDKAGGRPGVIGIYRLVMKKNSDNYRQSAVLDVMDALEKKGFTLIVFEPILPDGSLFEGRQVVNDLEAFAAGADLILANRYEAALEPVRDKVYTRDLFARD